MIKKIKNKKLKKINKKFKNISMQFSFLIILLIIKLLIIDF